MSNARNVWVFIEQDEGVIAPVSLELLAKGQELAQILGGEVWALLAGWGISVLADSLIQSGADRVLIADHPELELYRTLPYTRFLADLARQRHPDIFLIGATPNGRDLAPRLAVSLEGWSYRRLHRFTDRRLHHQERKPHG